MEAVPILKSVTRRHLNAAFEIRIPETFCPHNLTTDSDRHRKARQVLLGGTCTDDLPSLLKSTPAHFGDGAESIMVGIFSGFGCTGVAVRLTSRSQVGIRRLHINQKYFTKKSLRTIIVWITSTSRELRLRRWVLCNRRQRNKARA